MKGIFSAESGVSVSVSAELRQLVVDAYNRRGVGVIVSQDVVRESCSDLSTKTTEQILEIRRHERAVSPLTLSLNLA